MARLRKPYREFRDAVQELGGTDLVIVYGGKHAQLVGRTRAGRRFKTSMSTFGDVRAFENALHQVRKLINDNQE